MAKKKAEVAIGEMSSPPKAAKAKARPKAKGGMAAKGKAKGSKAGC